MSGKIKAESDKIILYTDFAAAIIVSVIASCAAFSNILFASDDLFNVTSDA